MTYIHQDKKGGKFVFIVLSVIIITVIVDTSIIKVYFLITPPLSLERDIIAFTVITIVYVVAQYFLLRRVKTRGKAGRLFALNLIHRIVFLIQVALAGLLIAVLVQMVTTSTYNAVVVDAAVMISYTLAIIMLGLLASRFYSWFKSTKNIVVLAYCIAAA